MSAHSLSIWVGGCHSSRPPPTTSLIPFRFGWVAVIRNRIRTRHRGKLSGHGTTFNIYLPLSDQEADQGKTEEEELIKGDETVLLVDDEAMILDVAAMLKKLNYRVISADSGEKAIELIRQADCPIDLIILDLIMPGMDGGETFDRIRELAPELPVIIASGYAMDGKAADFMAKGANGFIQKPFTIPELSQKARQVIDGA